MQSSHVVLSCVVGQKSLDETPVLAVTHDVHILGPTVHGTMGSCPAQLVDENNKAQANDIMIASTNTHSTWK
jgi:hypothetical protein